MAELPRTRLYWLLQSISWGIVLLVTFAYVTGDGELNGDFRLIVGVVVICLTGFGLTHLFRACVRRFHWFKLPIWLLAPAVLLANVAMSVMLVGIFQLYAILVDAALVEMDSWSAYTTVIVDAFYLFLFWSLIYFAVYSFRNYRHEEIERLKAEQAMRESELARLKSQMNPHFVFNALNSIRALVAEDPNKAQQSITQLSHLLRGFLLSDRHRTVPLAEEIRTVLDYLELEKLRYEDRLHYTLDLSAEAQHVDVPTMMVQTLVENAIKHGISKTVEGGEIDIRANVVRGELRLEIENSGDLNGSPFRQDGGFGLANTRMRLDLLFGNRASFDIYQARPGRVVAQVKMPATLQMTSSVTQTPLPLSA